MKKLCQGVLAFVLLLAMCSAQCYARESLHWYCIRTKANRQPPCPSEFPFIEGENAYFVDKAHGDTAQERVVYLTFDAGYENGNVERILNALREAEVTAAFFVLKHFITANPDLIQRMLAEGHFVCNHTANHPDLSLADGEHITAEIKELEEVFSEQTGKKLSPYFRPPEGSFSREMLQCVSGLGYKTVFWSFAYADWDNNKQPSKEKAMEIIMTNMHNGAVLLLHPTSKTNADILPQLITELKGQGYRFGTLEELCGGT